MKKIFTYEEAVELLPAVQRLTSDAVAELESLAEAEGNEEEQEPSPHSKRSCNDGPPRSPTSVSR